MTLKDIQKTHTTQLDQYDCGVACLLSIIKFYKDNLKEKFSEEVKLEKENYKWENFVEKILNLYKGK